MAVQVKGKKVKDLSDRLAELLGKCRILAGGTYVDLAAELQRQGADTVTKEKISKWRKFVKYETVPQLSELKAFEIWLAGVENGPPIARDLLRVCRDLRLTEATREAPRIKDLLAAASNEIKEFYAGHPHPTLRPDIVNLLQKALLEEIGNVLTDPVRLAYNLRYTIEVTGDTQGWRVETSNEAERVFAGKREVFVSFCSTREALDHEYRSQAEGCIARELVEVERGQSHGSWQKHVLTFTPRLVVDGLEINPGRAVPSPDKPYTLRRYFDVSATTLGEELTPTRLVLPFRLSRTTDEFPIHFNSYFCVGSTRIHFKISHPSKSLNVTSGVFTTSTESAPFRISKGSDNEITMETSRSAVLAPGTGVLFRWSSPSSARASSKDEIPTEHVVPPPTSRRSRGAPRRQRQDG